MVATGESGDAKHESDHQGTLEHQRASRRDTRSTLAGLALPTPTAVHSTVHPTG